MENAKTVSTYNRWADWAASQVPAGHPRFLAHLAQRLYALTVFAFSCPYPFALSSYADGTGAVAERKSISRRANASG